MYSINNGISNNNNNSSGQVPLEQQQQHVESTEQESRIVENSPSNNHGLFEGPQYVHPQSAAITQASNSSPGRTNWLPRLRDIIQGTTDVVMPAVVVAQEFRQTPRASFVHDEADQLSCGRRTMLPYMDRSVCNSSQDKLSSEFHRPTTTSPQPQSHTPMVPLTTLNTPAAAQEPVTRQTETVPVECTTTQKITTGTAFSAVTSSAVKQQEHTSLETEPKATSESQTEHTNSRCENPDKRNRTNDQPQPSSQVSPQQQHNHSTTASSAATSTTTTAPTTSSVPMSLPSVTTIPAPYGQQSDEAKNSPKSQSSSVNESEADLRERESKRRRTIANLLSLQQQQLQQQQQQQQQFIRTAAPSYWNGYPVSHQVSSGIPAAIPVIQATGTPPVPGVVGATVSRLQPVYTATSPPTPQYTVALPPGHHPVQQQQQQQQPQTAAPYHLYTQQPSQIVSQQPVMNEFSERRPAPPRVTLPKRASSPDNKDLRRSPQSAGRLSSSTTSSSPSPPSLQFSTLSPSHLIMSEFDSTRSDCLAVVDGFIRVQLSKKQPGGNGNRKFLEKQTVRVDFKPLLARSSRFFKAPREVIEAHFVPQFQLKCTLRGTSTRRYLDDLAEVQLIPTSDKKAPTTVSPLSRDFTMDVTFHELLVVFSSHNNQQQMYLRFDLINTVDNTRVSTIDSARFETITRRAIEKQRQKEKERRNRKRARELQGIYEDDEGKSRSSPQESSDLRFDRTRQYVHMPQHYDAAVGFGSTGYVLQAPEALVVPGHGHYPVAHMHIHQTPYMVHQHVPQPPPRPTTAVNMPNVSPSYPHFSYGFNRGGAPP